ncbi:MAG: tetrahydrofolate dehydrogenase/cyclohydrolase catalytic domain-containing protein, partial [Pseudomonadota bacterium]
MARIIDGKAHAAGLRSDVQIQTAALRETTGVQPGLAVVIVGEDPASQVYVRNKGRQAEEVGFASFKHELPADTSEQT